MIYTQIGLNSFLTYYIIDIAFIIPLIAPPIIYAKLTSKPLKGVIKISSRNFKFSRFELVFLFNASIKSLATPLLAPMIEEGFVNEEISQKIIYNYLSSPQIGWPISNNCFLNWCLRPVMGFNSNKVNLVSDRCLRIIIKKQNIYLN